MVRRRFVETEIVATGDGNARIHNLQINFPHSWNSSDMTAGVTEDMRVETVKTQY